jgi:hypothetical protein
MPAKRVLPKKETSDCVMVTLVTLALGHRKEEK